LVDHLLRIRSIKGAESELRACLEEGEYPEAIQLCQRFMEEIAGHQEFASVRALAKDSHRNENLIQQRLDASLLEVTRSFSEESYERLLRVSIWLYSTQNALTNLLAGLSAIGEAPPSHQEARTELYRLCGGRNPGSSLCSRSHLRREYEQGRVTSKVSVSLLRLSRVSEFSLIQTSFRPISAQAGGGTLYDVFETYF
jgi:hypothetical protein